MDQMAVYLFYFFGLLAIAGALGILITRNLMHAAFLLIAVFLSVAAIFVLGGAEFVAVSQIMVYVGGVLILLIFGIMLTNRISSDKIDTGFGNVLIGIFVGCAFLVWVGDYILTQFNDKKSILEQTENQTEKLGVSLIADHVLAFELIAILLLIALIGAAYIAKKDKEEEVME
jgi:NADH:ubiquinone oxidoreductase subunit 6 (subunit J)